MTNLINRELSWLEFNRRVLQEAQDPTNRLLERAKFLAIFATNLDEFFMIRVAGLHDQVAADVTQAGPEGMLPAQTLELVMQGVRALQSEHLRTWQEDVKPALMARGICVLDWHALNEEQRALASQLLSSPCLPYPHPAGDRPGASLPTH